MSHCLQAKHIIILTVEKGGFELKDYEVIMNIDLDKERKANLFIVSSSFDAARKIAGKILTENGSSPGVENKYFQVEDEYIFYSYISNGMKH